MSQPLVQPPWTTYNNIVIMFLIKSAASADFPGGAVLAAEFIRHRKFEIGNDQSRVRKINPESE